MQVVNLADYKKTDIHEPLNENLTYTIERYLNKAQTIKNKMIDDLKMGEDDLERENRTVYIKAIEQKASYMDKQRFIDFFAKYLIPI